MMPGKFAKQDLLFHPAHGLCRVDRVTEQNRSGKKIPCYSLVPKLMSRMKVRFEIAAPDLEVSGFHRIVSAKEANRILEYLKDGDGSAEQAAPAWALARNILFFSKEEPNPRDQRKRKLMEHSVKGLVGEFSCVFNTTVKEAARKIRQSLRSAAAENPLILAAFAQVIENEEE